jgi:cytochrome c biogenesis factor
MGIHELTAATANDNTVLVAVIGVLGVIVTAVGSVLAGRYSARKSAEAAKDTVKVTEKQVDFGALDGIVKNLQAEAGRLGARVTELEGRDLIKQQRIDALEQQVHATDTKYHVALTYIRDIIAWTKLVLNTDQVPPTPPKEIAADLSE